MIGDEITFVIAGFCAIASTFDVKRRDRMIEYLEASARALSEMNDRRNDLSVSAIRKLIELLQQQTMTVLP